MKERIKRSLSHLKTVSESAKVPTECPRAIKTMKTVAKPPKAKTTVSERTLPVLKDLLDETKRSKLLNEEQNNKMHCGLLEMVVLIADFVMKMHS